MPHQHVGVVGMQELYNATIIYKRKPQVDGTIKCNKEQMMLAARRLRAGFLLIG